MNYIFTEETGIIFQPSYVYIYNRKNKTFDIFNETCGDYIRLFDGEHSEHDIARDITTIYEVDGKENKTDSNVDVLCSNLGKTLSLVSHRNYERAQIVNRPHQY